MIKILLAGVWVCALTLGGVYAAVTMGGTATSTDGAEPEVPTQFVRGETISLPVVANGAVAGYFLTRVSVTVDDEKSKALKVPMTSYLTDELFTTLVGDKLIDIANVGSFDTAAFKTKVKDGINTRAGGEIITDIVIEQLDYISKADLQSPDQARRERATTIVEGTKVEPSAAPAAPSH